MSALTRVFGMNPFHVLGMLTSEGAAAMAAPSSIICSHVEQSVSSIRQFSRIFSIIHTKSRISTSPCPFALALAMDLLIVPEMMYSMIAARSRTSTKPSSSASPGIRGVGVFAGVGMGVGTGVGVGVGTDVGVGVGTGVGVGVGTGVGVGVGTAVGTVVGGTVGLGARVGVTGEG